MVPNPRRFGADTGGAIALSPAHREGVAVGHPGDIRTTHIRREGPVLAGVGGEFVECEPDGLRGSRLQAQLGALHGDARTERLAQQVEQQTGRADKA